MATEIVIDCGTGEATTRPDTFLASKPKEAVPTVAANPNQPLVDAITAATDYASLKANLLGVLNPKDGTASTPIVVAQPA